MRVLLIRNLLIHTGDYAGPGYTHIYDHMLNTCAMCMFNCILSALNYFLINYTKLRGLSLFSVDKVHRIYATISHNIHGMHKCP